MCSEVNRSGVPSHTGDQGNSFSHGSLGAKEELPDLANRGYPEFQINNYFSPAYVTFYLATSLFPPRPGREGRVGNRTNCQDETVRGISSIATWCRDLLFVPSLLLGPSQGRGAHHLIRPLGLNVGQAQHSRRSPVGWRAERSFQMSDLLLFSSQADHTRHHQLRPTFGASWVSNPPMTTITETLLCL